ncbi:hypothetical protein SDC9_56391 [bioreactor metagenome]|uniref:Uncharacterized protein n=1 Tax=bioreactor metagenome TaxID=1076179 RepID=A0A644X281_9ZZZZ
MQFAQRQIRVVDRGNLNFATRGRAHMLGNLHHAVIVEVEPRHCVVRFRMLRLLLNGEHALILVEFDHAERTRILDRIAKDCCAALTLHRFLERCGQILPVKHVVAKNQANRVVSNELLAEDKRIRQPARRLLHLVGKTHAQPFAGAQQALVHGGILRRGDDEHLRN